ncbi:MAG: DNA methyltransferase [Aliarcobacter sp.]|nr:DNA methyltransferase [Aliarcobacter sp.]
MTKKEQPLIKKLPIHKKYLPIVELISKNEFSINKWDIPYTIKELSYLVHSHYRYYGKFPPAVAGQILEQLPPPSNEHYVLDNFSGSGTTMVEAKLRGIKSYGTDISWLSVLASNVKVSHINLDTIQNLLNELITNFNVFRDQTIAPEDDFVLKWFDSKTVKDLTVIRNFIYNLKGGLEKDFILLAFVGILRRVSKAYNAEVRPHIDKNKKQRDVLEAFTKKIIDMSKDHLDFMELSSNEIESTCFHANNLSLPKEVKDKKCYLVISHPPYLNSFNYAPIFSIEFYWAKIFEPQYTSIDQFHKTELKAHPANEKITAEYFEHLKKCYTETFNIQEKGSYLAIVIGDCTRLGKVIPVLNILIQIVENIGYKTIEVNYRTTHYGLGKYAYKDRADYHSDNSEKKEGILIFKK